MQQALRADTCAPTLLDAWLEYRRMRNLKPRTERDYSKRLKQLDEWWDIPITQITEQQVAEKHREISLRSQSHANLVFKVLRAVLNYARIAYKTSERKPLLEINPVGTLSERRAWNRPKRRRTVISKIQLEDWFRGVYALDSAVVRDYLIVMILTGLRREEGAALQWGNVNLTAKTLRIVNPKNHEDHILPLTNKVYGILQARHYGRRSDNPFVFPGRVAGESLKSMEKSCDNVTARTGVEFCIQDLRRTFSSMARTHGIDKDIIKLLLNHKMGDVTDGYIIWTPDELRPYLQRIEDCILAAAGLGS